MRGALFLLALCLIAAPAGAAYKTYFNTAFMPDAPPACDGGDVLTHRDGKWLCTHELADRGEGGKTGAAACAEGTLVTGFDAQGKALCRKVAPRLVCHEVAEAMAEAHCDDGEFALSGGGACDCLGNAFLKTSRSLGDGWAVSCADPGTGAARPECDAAVVTCCRF